MTDSAQYTRCPQCKTAFKVTEKMLSMAHGKVRCGACLDVFQANEHILKPRQSVSQAQTSIQSSTTPPTSSTSDTQAIEDTQQATDPLVIEDTQEATDTQVIEDTQEATDAQVTEDTQEATDTQAIENTQDAQDTQAIEDTQEATDTQIIEDTQEATDTQVIEDTQEATDTQAIEDTQEFTDTQEFEDTQEPMPEDVHRLDSNQSEEKAEEAFDIEQLPVDSDSLALADDQSLQVLSGNLADQIADTDTQPDPLEEFEQRVEKKPLGLRRLMVSLVFIALLGFLGNNFWKNKQQLAYDSTWGGLTQTLCSVLPCNLKPRRDLSQIKLKQRIVTPSESQENLLDVKMLLVNEAGFAQPYPTIVVVFSNERGEAVAERRFTVADYLPTHQNQLMPTNVEVHLSFITEQPHPDALGFEFDFE